MLHTSESQTEDPILGNSDGDPAANTVSLGQALGAAERYIQQNQYKLAESLCQKILGRVPDNAAASYYLGLSYLSRGRMEEALPALENAVHRAPQHRQHWLAFISAHLKNRSYDTASRILEIFEKKFDSDKDNRRLKIQILFSQAEHLRATAASLCADLHRDHPVDADTLAQQAAIAASAGHFGVAIQYNEEALALNPACPELFLQQGRCLHRAGRSQEAVAALWRCCTQRPFSTATVNGYRELRHCFATDSQFQTLADLHNDLAAAWKAYAGEGLDASFGDHGLYYQGLDRLYIPGNRHTETRLAAYALDDYLSPGSRVLDIGCNNGFILLSLADRIQYGQGFDIANGLIAIGNHAAGHLGIRNVELSAMPFAAYQLDQPFDVVLAFAVHRWIGLPMTELGQKLAQFTTDGGYVVIESQGCRSTESIEPDFDHKMDAVSGVGFRKIRQGTLCDDGINLRKFVVLQKG